MNISGTILITKSKEYENSYSASLGGKKKDSDEYVNMYIPCFFSGEIEPPEKTSMIDVLDGFIVVREKKDGNTYFGLMVRDYEILKEYDDLKPKPNNSQQKDAAKRESNKPTPAAPRKPAKREN